MIPMHSHSSVQGSAIRGLPHTSVVLLIPIPGRTTRDFLYVSYNLNITRHCSAKECQFRLHLRQRTPEIGCTYQKGL